ncbi:MAG: hypothetical protein QNJ30_08630 [Kiloniellales bacterium]|nr:hypothetical protein [Kiloniellales bacterium]
MALNTRILMRGALAVGIAAVAAGCDWPRTYKWDWQQWSPNKLRYAAGEGAMLTEIRGNPFSVPKTKVEAVITDTMYGAHFGPRVPFVTQVPEDHRSPYRVVMVFDPEETLNSRKICAEPPQPGPANPDRIRVAAAFCSQEVHETSVWGTVGRTEGPDDPQFKALIRSMTTQLFPRQDPNERDNFDNGNDVDWVQ